MYQYDSYDQAIVDERAHQFDGQVIRRLGGSITENEFKPLRLQNGLYMQLHAYMLRVAVPYGLLRSEQLRTLAHIARTYDKGYGHVTTRQNVQYNWPRLQDVPKILGHLARVQMHSIQTSGNCIRNVTADHLAGSAKDELEDPRPYAEIIRQWSTFHPEFAFLPRKFKIGITGTPTDDRAAVRFHDIGVRIVDNDAGERGFEVLAGGGLGRSPFVAEVVSGFVQKPDLLSYLEAIVRVYNRYGRRDNKFKARIKILVDALGIEKFRELVNAEWDQIKNGVMKVTDEEFDRVRGMFTPPPFEDLPPADIRILGGVLGNDRNYAAWLRNNVLPHNKAGYNIVMVQLKSPGIPPGDISDTQMDALASLADGYSFGEIICTHTQNMVLPHVKATDLPELFAALHELDLASPNAGKVTDVIACPGLDFCNLANARSIPLALEIQERFHDIDYQNDLGDVSIKISGCINACGHHHVGNIGVLGIDKRGVEFYQLQLGGSPGDDASIGTILGPALPRDEIVDAVAAVFDTYLELRASDDERFLDTYRRVGAEPFREVVYAGD